MLNELKHKLLLVDDEPDILELVGFFLRREGYDVDCAPNGEVALGMLKENYYDVVICDYVMPKMDGITLLKKVRENKDYTSFVFFSGNADQSHEVKMAGLGAFQLILKTDFEILPEAVKKAIKYNEQIQESRSEKTQEMEDFLKIPSLLEINPRNVIQQLIL